MKCTPKVKDVYDFIDSIAPFNMQCEWDNSGLLVGSPDVEVKRIGVVLDLTQEAISYATENKIDLIVSHHPVIFKACKNFVSGNPAFELAKNGISAICAHTSLDCAKGGVNDALADALEIKNTAPLTDQGDAAMVRAAEISETSGEELAKLVAQKLSTAVRLADSGKAIRKVALCGGAGGDFIKEVAALGCDAFVTGDASHHVFLDSLDLGLTLIAAGHFETENPVVAMLANKLKQNFDCEIEIIPQSSPIKYF